MSGRRIVVALAAAGAVAAVAVFATRSHGTGAAAAPLGAGAPTWRDVAPIFAEKCAGCHSLGGIAPFALTSGRSAAAHARSILRVTQRGAMPPWMPGSDSPEYLGQSRRILTRAEKNLIARWVRGGARIGRGGTIAPDAPAAGGTGTAVTLAPRRAYLPRAAVGGMDDYHCFLLETRVAEDSFVTSAVVRPERTEIVHHVILFEATGANLDDARRLDAASGGKGWTCFGGPGLSETHPTPEAATSDRLGAPQWIGAWVPGHTTNETPAGTGVLLHAGAAVVMQVHYNLIHRPRPDRSRAVLRLVPAAAAGLTPLDTMLIPAPVELPCPAGVRSPLCSRDRALADERRKYGSTAALIPLGLLYICDKSLADYRRNLGDATDVRTSCDRRLNRPLTIYGVGGHMHTRGFDIAVELNPGTPRAQVLVHIPRWDFHWQDAYYLAQPVEAEPGDVIRVTCRFDNSAGNQPVVGRRRLGARYVLWGEGTTDEMCLGLLQVATRTP